MGTICPHLVAETQDEFENMKTCQNDEYTTWSVYVSKESIRIRRNPVLYTRLKLLYYMNKCNKLRPSGYILPDILKST